MTTHDSTPRHLDDRKAPGRDMNRLRAAVSAYASLTSRARIRDIRPVGRDLSLVVARAGLEATDVMGVTLTAPDGNQLPEWTPGAHLELVLPSGRLRQYSLCGDPADRSTYRIAVRRIPAGGGGSLEVHQLTAGTPVTVRGPRNAFPFAYPHLAKRDIQTVAFIAGGIGITPILPMVQAAATSNTPWTLTCVGRDDASMPFLDQLSSLTSGKTRILHGTPTMDDVLTDVDKHTSVYFCGPPTFLDAIRGDLTTRPHAGFHFERFAPPPTLGGRPFTIRLERSGINVNVPANQSALAAIRQALPDVPYSCQQGFCGTCRVGILAGHATQRGTSAFLARRDTMLTCVDRANDTHITIDL